MGSIVVVKFSHIQKVITKHITHLFGLTDFRAGHEILALRRTEVDAQRLHGLINAGLVITQIGGSLEACAPCSRLRVFQHLDASTLLRLAAMVGQR